jgi:hypothetical protein
MNVTTKLPNGHKKTYTYQTIGGIPINEYMRAKRKRYYQPYKRVKKYQTLPIELREFICVLHDAGVGAERISKALSNESLVISTSCKPSNYSVSVDCVRKLLKDTKE